MIMTNTLNQSLKTPWWEWLLLLAALAIFGAVVMTGSRQKSASFDEQNHLTAGYTYLKTGDPRLSDAHPPLAAALAATALLSHDDIVLPLEDPTWERGDRVLFADVFFWQSNANQQELLVAARIPIMLVGMLLLAGLWLWGRQMAGRWAGWIALFLAMLDPNLIANSRVVTTDLVLTAFFFLAMWRFYCWLKQPSWLNAIWVGILAGLTISTKYTGLLIWPVALACGLIYMTTLSKETRQSQWKTWLLGFVGMGLISLLVLWAVYGFALGVPADFPLAVPLPAPFFWQSLWRTFVKLPNEAASKLNFLLGEVSPGGWWYYFPVALAVKTPLPALILSLVGFVAIWRNGHFDKLKTGRLRETASVWLPPLAFLALGMTGKLTIGYRHMLPGIPFLILLGGLGGGWLISLSSRKRPLRQAQWSLPGIALAVLLIWFGYKAIRIAPHQEAYFNELAGDWTNWSEILVDSNLDWGQDLLALRQLMHDYGLAEVNLAYFGLAVPEYYDINYKPLPGYWRLGGGAEVAAFNPYTPAPGWYAISATSLRLGLLSPETADYYAMFREMEPVSRAGYSIYLYHIPEEMYAGENRVVVAGEPIGKPVGQHSAVELGIQPPQRTIAKWTSSPDTTIYPLSEGFTADYVSVEANFEDVMMLLGYELGDTSTGSVVVSPQGSLPITLYWQVGEQPMAAPAPTAGPPLSAFVHLTGDEVWQVVAQVDGWGTALRGLEPGDVIAQRVYLPIGDVPTGEYTLLTGLYSPQTGERLMLKTAVSTLRPRSVEPSSGQAVDGKNFVRLETVSVEE